MLTFARATLTTIDISVGRCSSSRRRSAHASPQHSDGPSPGLSLAGAEALQIPIDPNGNLASKTEGTDNWTYEWNAENQLKRVLKNGVEQARFSYDPKGRRVEKVAGGVTTNYQYDAEDIVREARGEVIFKYVHGPGIDEPLAREEGTGTISYYHADGLGSVLKRTSSAGVVVHNFTYDAWGNVESGASESGYAFTGREWDPEVGLFYYRNRYYDPEAGRFTSEDPIGHDGGLNLYRYVADNPVVLTDPSGLWITTELTVLPPARVPRTTSKYDAMTYSSFSITKASPCSRRGGTWGFDATIAVTLRQEFFLDPSTVREAGGTLQQHEDLHVLDYRRGWSSEQINDWIKTEGFCSPEDCEAAKGRLLETVQLYQDILTAYTAYLRDPAP